MQKTSATPASGTSQTDWNRVFSEYDRNAPIAYDDEDRAEGLYDPNDAEAVRAAWSAGTVTRGVRGPQKSPTKQPISIRLSPDVLAHYRARGKGWQAEIDRILRQAMRP